MVEAFDYLFKKFSSEINRKLEVLIDMELFVILKYKVEVNRKYVILCLQSFITDTNQLGFRQVYNCIVKMTPSVKHTPPSSLQNLYVRVVEYT